MLMPATKPQTMVKTALDVEKLLLWAYRTELPKRPCTDRSYKPTPLANWLDFGTVIDSRSDDPGFSTDEPVHPDAITIEDAVSELPPWMCDWSESLDAIMGDLAGLLTVNDLQREQEERGRITQSSWPSKTYSKTQRRAQAVNKPRDVIFVGSIDMAALVVSHARQGTRPRWYPGGMTCRKTPARNNANLPMVIGECRAKDVYTAGSCCPLIWGIPGDKWGDVLVTPFSIATARADYLAWWRGLAMLAESLVLAEHVALPPTAPQLPWCEGVHENWIYGDPGPQKHPQLLLKPARAHAGRTRGQGEDIPRRHQGRRVAL